MSWNVRICARLELYSWRNCSCVLSAETLSIILVHYLNLPLNNPSNCCSSHISTYTYLLIRTDMELVLLSWKVHVSCRHHENPLFSYPSVKFNIQVNHWNVPTAFSDWKMNGLCVGDASHMYHVEFSQLHPLRVIRYQVIFKKRFLTSQPLAGSDITWSLYYIPHYDTSLQLNYPVSMKWCQSEVFFHFLYLQGSYGEHDKICPGNYFWAMAGFPQLLEM